MVMIEVFGDCGLGISVFGFVSTSVPPTRLALPLSSLRGVWASIGIDNLGTAWVVHQLIGHLNRS